MRPQIRSLSMGASYEELDHRKTSLGDLVLRRRRPPGMGDLDVYEITLNDDLLMSSLLNESEVALAQLGVAAAGEDTFEVLVGGLGLGYTVHAALNFDRVLGVTVVELLPEVIGWHEKRQVPLGAVLTRDERCRIVQGDFFSFVTGPVAAPGEGYGAILVDIDHAPDSWLHENHEGFYREEALRAAARWLRPGGAFAFWSSGERNEDFAQTLGGVFEEVQTHAITAYNPMIDEDQVDTIYVATVPA